MPETFSECFKKYNYTHTHTHTHTVHRVFEKISPSYYFHKTNLIAFFLKINYDRLCDSRNEKAGYYHYHILKKKKKKKGEVVGGITVIIGGNRHDDPSSHSGQCCLCFTLC